MTVRRPKVRVLNIRSSIADRETAGTMPAPASAIVRDRLLFEIVAASVLFLPAKPGSTAGSLPDAQRLSEIPARRTLRRGRAGRHSDA
jgi:hypothetical protein